VPFRDHDASKAEVRCIKQRQLCDPQSRGVHHPSSRSGEGGPTEGRWVGWLVKNLSVGRKLLPCIRKAL
jgi:hypothetical protein